MKIQKRYLESQHKFKHFQKKCSYGNRKLVTNTSYRYGSKAIVICIKSTRLTPEKIEAFLRVSTIIRNKHHKNRIKKFRNKQLVTPILNMSTTYSKKAKGLRMGKGKGDIIEKGIAVRVGQKVFEIDYRYSTKYLIALLKKSIRKLSSHAFALFLL